MASKKAGVITKVNTLVNADLSSGGSDDESGKGKMERYAGKKNSTITDNKNHNDKNPHGNINTGRYDEIPNHEKIFGKKTVGKYQAYFLPHLVNGYYPPQPVNNSDYPYCNLPDPESNVCPAAPLWNRSHFENAELPRQNPLQPKYYPDFIINNPALSEISHGNTLDNLPSAHHVAKDNELSRYYSVLELPRVQKNHVTFSPEPIKDNRYYYGKPHLVTSSGPYLRNKQQLYKAPPMEAQYENPNGQFRFERGVNNGFDNAAPRFESQSRPAVQTLNSHVPHGVNNFPDQYSDRNFIINPNQQGLRSPYSVHGPGHLISQSLNNVYVAAPTYPLRTQTGTDVFSGNENGRCVNRPQVPNSPLAENHDSTGIPTDNPEALKDSLTRSKSNILNVANVSLDDSKNPCDVKSLNSPGFKHLKEKFAQDPYEGNNLSTGNTQNQAKEGSTAIAPSTDILPESKTNQNLSNGQADALQRILEALKMTYEHNSRMKQNAEVQNTLPEILREDKTTDTQNTVEDKETQYKPMSTKVSLDEFREIGTQVRYVEHSRPQIRKCQGVTAMNSNTRNRSPSDLKHSDIKKPFKKNMSSSESKYYVELGESQHELNLDKKTKAYQEIADIIKRESGKVNEDMADVIFNMIYGKNCQIVVQKGVTEAEDKINNTHRKNFKKNTGMSTITNLNSGFKNKPKPTYRDMRTSPIREKPKAKDQVTSPIATLFESGTTNEKVEKPEKRASCDKIKEKEILKKIVQFHQSSKTCNNKELNYYIKNQFKSENSDSENGVIKIDDLSMRKYKKKGGKVKFDPVLINIGKDDVETEEIVVDLESEKILQCILQNNNTPKGEIIIDVGCVQLPNGSGKISPEQNLKIKEKPKELENGKISAHMSRTELYEEAILNLIAKQIKKCTSEWKFDIKDEEEEFGDGSKRSSPVNQIVGENRRKSNSEEPTIPVSTTRLQLESNSHLNLQINDDENTDRVSSTGLKKTNAMITNGDQELNEFYENIKYLFSMLNDGEKLDFITDVMKKITNVYSAESKSSICQSPKAHNLDLSDSKRSIESEEENAIAQVLRMICYENDVDGLLSSQVAKKESDAEKRADSTHSDAPSSLEIPLQDEIMSNYVLLDTPDVMMGKRFVNKTKGKYHPVAQTKTVSRGVTANL